MILAVRNLELGAQRAAEIGGDTSVVKLDLADQSSVRAFPDLFDGDVDVLINNAGLVAQHRTDTVDGFEITIGTNFLGPFALTNLLFGRVRSKIINVGSDAHKSATYPPRRSASAHPQVVGVPGLRPLEAGGHAVGPGARPAAAGGGFAGHELSDPPRLGGVEPVQRLRQRG